RPHGSRRPRAERRPRGEAERPQDQALARDHRRRIHRHPRPDDLQARRMTLLALIRPDSWNWALLLHVGGAMILVGGLVTAGAASMMMRRDATGTLAAFSYRILLLVALPGFILMRAGAAWIYD